MNSMDKTVASGSVVLGTAVGLANAGTLYSGAIVAANAAGIYGAAATTSGLAALGGGAIAAGGGGMVAGLGTLCLAAAGPAALIGALGFGGYKLLEYLAD